MESRTKLTSPRTLTQGNPDVPPGVEDPVFRLWRDGGITTLGDLFNGSALISFTQLQQKYVFTGLTFFSFVQVGHSQ